jgi:hypothetical protein
LDQAGKEKLFSLHAKGLNTEEQTWILGQMKKHQVIERATLEAKVLIDEAITLMNFHGEEALSGIAKEMIERDF